jgi:hypothetical protein
VWEITTSLAGMIFFSPPASQAGLVRNLGFSPPLELHGSECRNFIQQLFANSIWQSIMFLG